MPTGKPVSLELEQEVVKYYLSKPTTISDTGAKFGLCNPTIIKILDKNNVERYKKAQVYNPNMNEHYFEKIDTEAKAYYLGIIITDGNVFVPKNGGQSSISITQKEDDEYILERFLDEVHSNTSLGHDGRGCSQAAIRSNIMASDLEKYGIQPNKTLTTYLPEINKDMMSHLIRGILDGDGSISAHLDNRKKYYHYLSFCGTHKLMEDISEFLVSKLMVRVPKIYDYSNRNLSQIKWGAINDIFLIGEYLYGDASIYLERKFKKYNEFKTHYKL